MLFILLSISLIFSTVENISILANAIFLPNSNLSTTKFLTTSKTSTIIFLFGSKVGSILSKID